MHVKPAAVALSFLALALGACVSSSSKLNRIYFGMSKGDVVALLGEPSHQGAQANVEYLTYYLTDPASGNRQAYMVRCVDARVDSFGRFVPLLEMFNGPGNSSPAVGMGAVIPYSVNMDVVTKLQQLKALNDVGALNDDEFQRARQRLLADVN